jgi:hypothetical protein
VEFVSACNTCMKTKRFLRAVLQRKVGQAAWSFKRIVHMCVEPRARCQQPFGLPADVFGNWLQAIAITIRPALLTNAAKAVTRLCSENSSSHIQPEESTSEEQKLPWRKCS